MKLIRLPAYLYCRHKDKLPGDGIILQKDYPHIIGRVVLYDNHDIMLSRTTTADLLAHAIVPGYTITIQFAGTFPNNKFPAMYQKSVELYSVIKEMAQFFLDSEIHYQKGKYRNHIDTPTH